MNTISENLWTHNDKMTLGAVPLHLRMTVIKLNNGELWLHSPTRISDSLMQSVNALGTLAYIIAPNNGHNLWLKEWVQAYPNAKVYVSRGIPKKLPTLGDYIIIEEQSALPWQDEIELASMPSVNFFDEQVFFHKASRSLIVTDLVQNHANEKVDGIKAKVSQRLLKIIGFNNICIAPPLRAGFLIKDKAAFTLFIQRILAWDFDRVIVTHGNIISQDAKTTLEKLFQRFLK